MKNATANARESTHNLHWALAASVLDTLVTATRKPVAQIELLNALVSGRLFTRVNEGQALFAKLYTDSVCKWSTWQSVMTCSSAFTSCDDGTALQGTARALRNKVFLLLCVKMGFVVEMQRLCSLSHSPWWKDFRSPSNCKKDTWKSCRFGWLLILLDRVLVQPSATDLCDASVCKWLRGWSVTALLFVRSLWWNNFE